MTDATNILHNDLDSMIAYLPRLLGAMVILLVGYLVARLLGRLVSFLLSEVGLDRLGERSGLADTLTAAGLPPRPSQLGGRLAFVVVLIAALVQTVDALGLAPLSQSLRQLLEFTPHVLLAVMVLLAGAVVGDMLGGGITAAMKRTNMLYHALGGSLVRGLVLVLAVLLALQQLTLDARYLLDVLLVILAGAALTTAIAVGWGSRTMVENLVAARYVEQNFTVGDPIWVDGAVGTVERIGPTSAVLRAPDGGKIVVPNAVLARSVIQPGPAAGRETAEPGADA